MDFQSLTIIVILMQPILLLVWLVYDVFVKAWLQGAFGTPTITTEIQSLSAKFIAIPFMTGLIIGLLCGHLFGQF